MIVALGVPIGKTENNKIMQSNAIDITMIDAIIVILVIRSWPVTCLFTHNEPKQ